MNPVVRRIAIHAVISAVVLGAFGLLFVQVASVWLEFSDPGARPGERVVSAEVDDAFVSALRARVPFYMLAGVTFVVLCEVAAHWWRSRKGTPPPAVPQPQPDEAERLLLELLSKSEAARGTPPQEPAVENQQQEAAQPDPHPESSSVAK
jgi:hypothetical protein